MKAEAAAEPLRDALARLVTDLDAFFGPDDADKPTDIRKAVKAARRVVVSQFDCNP